MTHALIVEDHVENQVILGETLESIGLTFDCASSISEAVSLVASQSYDVALMDLAIPNRRDEEPNVFGGLEAVRQIQALLGDRELPIILVTAGGMREIESRLQGTGIRELVDKSMNFAVRVTEAIGRVVELSSAVAVISADDCESELDRGSFPEEKSVAFREEQVTLIRHASDPETVSGDREAPLNVDARDELISTPGSDVMPATIDDLRAEIRDQLASALGLLDQRIDPQCLVERDQKTQHDVADLREQIQRAFSEVGDPRRGPAADESFRHWIVNLMFGPANRVSRMLESEAEDHFGQLSHVVEPIRDRIQRSIQLAKAPIAETRVVGRPADLAPSPDAASIPEVPTQATPRRRDLAESKRLILIVDDQPEARRDLETKLTRLDYRVVSCERSRTALDLLDLQRFDVCLLDLHMPEIDGLEMIKQIRQSPTSCNASIIVVSGSSDQYAAADAIEKGADDYLEKPADERLLQARIRSCLRQTDARLAELSKFMPRHVLEHVINNMDLLDKPSPADVTVIVCDVRGFSRISERMGPVQTINWISDVMNELSRIILEHGGTIIDYVGDEIMAMWGAPIASTQHAADACRCALEIQAATARLSDKWRAIVNAEIRIGIGINSGLAVVGNTGSKHRIKYGPLGDTVNVASRVQGATKYLHSPVLITQSTASRIDRCFKGRRVCGVRVQNISEPLQLFELADCHSEESIASRIRYEAALSAFESENLSEALTILAEILCTDPSDGPCKLLMMRVIQSQLGGSFDPIWTLPGK